MRHWCCRYRFEMDDGAVGHDGMVSLHQVQLTAAVLSRLVQAVDRAALGAGADGHAGDGLITADAVYCSRSTCARLQLLERGREREKKGCRVSERTGMGPEEGKGADRETQFLRI